MHAVGQKVSVGKNLILSSMIKAEAKHGDAED